MPDTQSLVHPAPVFERIVFRVPGRSGAFRIMQFFGVVLSGVGLLAAILAAAFQLSPQAVFAHPDKVPQLAMALYVVGLYALLMGTAWWVWKRDGGRLEARFSPGLLIEGWLHGLGGLAALTAFELATGLAHLKPHAALQEMVLFSAVAVGMAFSITEEILFRGFFLGLLGRDMARHSSFMVSAALFAGCHFLHPFAWKDALVPFFGLWSAGALLASCRLRTGSLWLGIGLHAAWVFYVTAVGQLGLLEFPEAGRLLTGGGSPASGLLGPLFLIPTYLLVRARYGVLPRRPAMMLELVKRVPGGIS